MLGGGIKYSLDVWVLRWVYYGGDIREERFSTLVSSPWNKLGCQN